MNKLQNGVSSVFVYIREVKLGEKEKRQKDKCVLEEVVKDTHMNS